MCPIRFLLLITHFYIEWDVVSVAPRMGTKIYLCLNEIGLHAQYMVIVQGQEVNIIWGGGEGPCDHLMSMGISS